MAKAKAKEPEWEGIPKSDWKYWRKCHCGQEFGTNRKNQVNHSDDCRLKKAEKRKAAPVPLKDRKNTCVICDRKFVPEQWNQETCPESTGRPCAHQHHLNQQGVKRREKQAKKAERRTCIEPGCPNTFAPKGPTQLTCSDECAASRKSRLAKQKRLEGKLRKMGEKAQEEIENFNETDYAEEVDRVAQKKKEIQRKADEKVLRDFLAGEARDEVRTEAFSEATQAYPPRDTHKLWTPGAGGSKHSPEHAVLMLADPHFGELVRIEDTGGLGESNIDLLADRVRFAFWKASDMLVNLIREQGLSVEHLHVILLGDNVTGEFIYGSQPFHLDLSLEQQGIIGSDIVARGIMSLADHFKETTVVGIRGNHGEMRQGGRKTKSRTNFDGTFYDSLQKRMSLQKDISVIIPKTWWYIHDILGWGFLLQHKNQGQSSLGTPYYAMDRDAAKMRLMLRKNGLDFYYYVIAHWHHFEHAELPFGERIVCPSVIGTTLYSAEDLRATSIPSVLFFGMSEKYGQTWFYKIKLERDLIPEEMQLGAELWWECSICGKKGYGIPDVYRGGQSVCLECVEG